MTQRLHLVFGGELIDPTKTAFKGRQRHSYGWHVPRLCQRL